MLPQSINSTRVTVHLIQHRQFGEQYELLLNRYSTKPIQYLESECTVTLSYVVRPTSPLPPSYSITTHSVNWAHLAHLGLLQWWKLSGFLKSSHNATTIKRAANALVVQWLVLPMVEPAGQGSIPGLPSYSGGSPSPGDIKKNKEGLVFMIWSI
jgi:hypothetical protein